MQLRIRCKNLHLWLGDSPPLLQLLTSCCCDDQRVCVCVWWMLQYTGNQGMQDKAHTHSGQCQAFTTCSGRTNVPTLVLLNGVPVTSWSWSEPRQSSLSGRGSCPATVSEEHTHEFQCALSALLFPGLIQRSIHRGRARLDESFSALNSTNIGIVQSQNSSWVGV